MWTILKTLHDRTVAPDPQYSTTVTVARITNVNGNDYTFTELFGSTTHTVTINGNLNYSINNPSSHLALTGRFAITDIRLADLPGPK